MDNSTLLAVAGRWRTVDDHSDRGNSGKSISGHTSQPDSSYRIEKGRGIRFKKKFDDHPGRSQLRVYINPEGRKATMGHHQILDW